MQRYKYKAVSKNGRPMRGVLAAGSETDLYNQLQEAGMELIDCKAISSKKNFSLGSLTLKRIKTRDLIQFFVHMEQMQAAGVPMLEALADVRDTTENPRLRDVMAEIYRDVSDGSSLSEAMGRHPKIFTNLYLSLIQAGEETGDLTLAYTQLIKYLKWIDSMQSKVKKATRYPMIVMGVVLVTVVVMMGYVVPQIVDFIRNLEQELPFYTTALISTSDFFRAYWWVVLGAPVVLFVGLKSLTKISYQFAYNVDALMLRMPIFGEVIRKISAARYTQTFGALFDAGINVISALKSARSTVHNLVLLSALERVEHNVQSGSSLSEAFGRSGEFPSMVVRMLKIGEESGNLAEVLQHVSDFYTRDVDEAIEGFIASIEPALTALLGGIILWIAAGVFGPIYSSFENIDF
ncbi:MAG: type II secretion system F family protein [Alphaproteobacteria bacterium]